MNTIHVSVGSCGAPEGPPRHTMMHTLFSGGCLCHTTWECHFLVGLRRFLAHLNAYDSIGIRNHVRTMCGHGSYLPPAWAILLLVTHDGLGISGATGTQRIVLVGTTEQISPLPFTNPCHKAVEQDALGFLRALWVRELHFIPFLYIFDPCQLVGRGENKRTPVDLRHHTRSTAHRSSGLSCLCRTLLL